MDYLNGKLYLICAFSLAGTSVISARFVMGKLGTFTITAVSLFFALVFLVSLCGKQLVRYIPSMSFRTFLFLSLQALCGIFLFRMFLLSGLYYTSAGEAGILTGATPAITAFLAMVVLREPVSRRKLAGILCTVGGILIIQGILTPGNGLSLEHLGGNILVLCAAACESAFNTLSRISAVKAAADLKESSSPIAQTTIVTAIALILCLIPAMLEHPLQELSGIGLMEWAALLWYGVFVTALAFICWYSGIKRCGAFTAAAFSGMMPFTALLLSTVVLGESADYQQWLGGFLVIAGMILIGTEGRDAASPLSRNRKSRGKEQVKE
ncbi:DMT family transporter [Desulfosporosinus sp. PR]|uniref:DMT family transporter n=1 Tax=Candidatus Desulfosporosinus nitrosoreducens TaxID=3401928 RepID=UPI0027F531E7|nr:DMT family transporter [Desulfosporosinus sp. PR]MDQ7096545.1 DMT family transporter [Desulfosporosinus sp. PR]